MKHREQQRITGIENEWSIVYDDPAHPAFYKPLSSADVDVLLRRFLPNYLSISDRGGLASNGMRIYRDPLAFVETATAEESSLTGIVASDIATEHIIASVVESAIEANEIPQSSRVNKRVVADHDPERKNFEPTWGYHVNFAADSEKLSISDERLLPLGLQLATMNIYAGAGMIRHFGPDTTYVIGQKTLNLNCLSAGASYNTSQPLISMRGEHHADNTKHIRLHVTSMDPHISPWATWMSIGTTSIVIRLMEQGYLGNDIVSPLSMPLHVIARQVAGDPDLTNVYLMEHGRTMSALDIQNHLYNRACQLDLSPDEAAIMPEWRRALDTLAHDPNDLVEADWVMRRRLIHKKIGNAGVGLDSKIARYWNDQYDMIYQAPVQDQSGAAHTPLVNLLRTRSVFANHMPSAELIQQRIVSPPPETRAHIRGRLIQQHIAKRAFAASWSAVAYTDNTGNKHTFDLSNPYDNIHENEIITPPEE